MVSNRLKRMVFASRILAFSIAALILCSGSALAQGIRMAPDFLPLDVGNLWRYDVLDQEGAAVGTLEFRITEFSIVDGASFYLFDRFPFSPDLEVNRPVGIRYDSRNRQFIWFDGTSQADLFPSLGASAEVLESDENGIPSRALFTFGSMVLTLERGIGITQAGFLVEGVPRVASLIAARVAGSVLGATAADAPAPTASSQPLIIADPIDETTTPEEVAPELTVEAVAGRDSHRFILTVRNPSAQLMPFDFTSSQSYDFVVVDPAHGQEIWRWSLRHFFSEVVRSEAIRPEGEWSFEGEWTYRDNALDEVDPGTYEVYGILTAETPIESDSIRFEVE